MSSQITVIGVCLWFFTAVTAADKELCQRLYLKGLDEENVAFVQLGGVYKLTNLMWHGFPVLESERSPGDYFYYHRDSNQFFVGKDNQSSHGLGATTRSIPDGDGWISTAHPEEPYSDILDKWFQFDWHSEKNVIITKGQDSIGLHCVNETTDIIPCSSGSFTLNQQIVWEARGSDPKVEVFTPGLHHFELVPDLFTQMRPVYQRRGGSGDPVYLYYYKNLLYSVWVIGPDYRRDGAFAYVSDKALSSDYINGTWLVDNNGKFEANPELKLQCSGVPQSMAPSGCTGSLCQNSGTCLANNNIGEVFCVCKDGFTGSQCETQEVQCPRIEGSVFPPDTTRVLYEGTSQGAVATFICDSGFTPDYFNSRCAHSQTQPSVGEWKHFGSCEMPRTTARTTPPKPQTTTKFFYDDADDDSGWSWEEPEWLTWVLMPIQIFLEVAGPMFFWMFCCKSSGYCRVASVLYWVLFWVYVPLTIFCSATQCGGFSSSGMGTATIIAEISMPIFAIFIWIESYRSRERQYISKLSETDTVSKSIQVFRRTQPALVWTVTCYHYETRVRTVYYTDAQGNQQSRTETYQEMVVTHTDAEVFEFNFWLDDSESAVKGIEKYRITRIKLEKSVMAGDTETAQVMHRQKTDFQDRNRNRDVYMSFEECALIPGFEKRLAAYVDESARSWWIGHTQFWIATLLMLTWPYRWLFRYASGKTTYTVSKKLFLSRPNPTTSGKDVMAFSADEANKVQVPMNESAKDGEGEQEQTHTERLTVIPVELD